MAFFHSPNIVTDGLIICYDAGDQISYPGSGTTWTDLSGNGHVGTLTNGPTFNTGSDVTDTLTRAESGTLFTVDGTGDIVVNMPALSTANVGTSYEFISCTALSTL